jgi:CHAT domain-containing protein/tetratricopeptide (TPR) repeat protein
MPIVRPSRPSSLGRLTPLTRHDSLWLVLVCCAIPLTETSCRAKPAAETAGVRDIDATESVAALIAADHRTYRVTLKARQAVRVLVDQHDTDLAMTVVLPDGRPLRTVDTRERGVESVTILADTGGVFKIDVRPLSPSASGTAHYDVRLEEPPHLATSMSEVRQRAESLASEGKRLAADGTADSQRHALERLRSSLPLWRQLSDVAGEAAALAMIGDVLHIGGEFEAAETEHLHALTLSRQLGDHRQVGELLNNIGVGRWRRGDLKEAMHYLEEALGEWRSVSFRSGEAAALTNEGNLFFESSDYQQALDRYMAALKIFQADHDAREAYTLNNIGVTYRLLGDLDAALTYVSRSLPRFRDASDQRAEGRAFVRLAQIQLARGDTRTAEATATKALNVIRRIDDSLAEADALDVLGQIASADGDMHTALSDHKQALTRYRAIGVRRGEATALHHLGTVLASTGETARGLEELERALAIRHEAGLRDAEAETLYQIALVQRKAGKLSHAQARLNAALALTEDVRGRVAGEYSRTTYFAARQTYFAAYIHVLMERHERHPSGRFAAQAFEASERERARSLLDLLGESRADIRRGVDPTLFDREREQQRQLDFWSYRLAALVDRKGMEDQAEQVREKIRDVLADYRETQARIRVASPRYAALTSPPPLSAEAVQREVLDPDTILLRYALGDQHSYVWVMTQQSLKANTLPPKADIDALARKVYSLVSEKRVASNAADLLNRYQHNAEQLSAMLLGPVAADLRARRLLIVCDGALQFVPFAALPEPGAHNLMVAKYEIVMLPSASTLAVLRRQNAGRPPAPKTVAVLADPVYEPNDPRLGRHTAAAAGDAGAPPPSRLLFSRFEGESILNMVPASQRYEAFGFAASRETAISPVLRDYRVVHFAAHAVPDDMHPELSGIVFSLLDPRGAPLNGLLRIHDIYDANLQADLVVLSACQTAIGKDVPGEGLMGLARGFLSAGASRVVASQYKVEDEATAELMRTFYQAMLGPDRRSPAAALRVAQMKMAAHPRWNDPYWWSAFVITGEPR